MEREKYQKLTVAERGHRQKAKEFGEEAEKLEREQARLDGEAVKAEALEERGWQDKAAAADRNRAEAGALRAAIEHSQALAEIINGEKAKLHGAVREEILSEYRQKYQAELKRLHAMLKAAVAVERSLTAIEDKLQDETVRYLGERGSLLPNGAPNLMCMLGADAGLPEFETIIRNNGYEL